jgi:galactose mutarotase-like enzyme
MLVVLQNKNLSATINLLGAEIRSVKNKQGVEFIWQAEEEWGRSAPVLFPIVGKLKNNEYVFENNTYSLAQHGFARDNNFEVVECTETKATFELKSNAETKKNYPFDFVFKIGYELTNNTLTINYGVKNPSTQNLLFSVGAHPGFNCPLLSNERFEDYYLEFEKNNYKLTELTNGLRLSNKKELNLTNNRLAITHSLFNNDALVFENNQINEVSLCSNKSKHKITLSCKNWPYFGIWAKKECTKFICLEPWHGIADSEASTGQLQQKEGIINLAPQAVFNASYSISFV